MTITDRLLIHVRFAPDGAVREIGERPAELSPQAWFDRLHAMVGAAYQPLSGGRGVFRLARAEIDAVAAGAVH